MSADINNRMASKKVNWVNSHLTKYIILICALMSLECLSCSCSNFFKKTFFFNTNSSDFDVVEKSSCEMYKNQ